MLTTKKHWIFSLVILCVGMVSFFILSGIMHREFVSGKEAELEQLFSSQHKLTVEKNLQKSSTFLESCLQTCPTLLNCKSTCEDLAVLGFAKGITNSNTIGDRCEELNLGESTVIDNIKEYCVGRKIASHCLRYVKHLESICIE